MLVFVFRYVCSHRVSSSFVKKICFRFKVSWSEEEDVRLIEMYQENEHLMQDGGELDIEAFAHSFEGVYVNT